ncbi:MAG: hypothetical protein J6J36_08545 [Clostridia bacterium]|nr:hypothetical protein [Clostridia bacterium]
MENNTLKENYLEVIPQKSMVFEKEKNNLPVLKDCRNLLPVIIKKKELALITIDKELDTIKQNRIVAAIKLGIVGLAKLLKFVTMSFVKLIRWSILVSTRCISFIVVSALVLLSTTIITKNIVNSYYGSDLKEDDTSFSIFNVKDDVEASSAKPVVQEHEVDENENNIHIETGE